VGDRIEDRAGILPKEEGCVIGVKLARTREISRGQYTV